MMDTFFEQIVAIKKTAKTWLAFFGTWFLTAVLSIGIIFFLFPFVGAITIILAAGVIFAAYKISMFFSIEYEYIVTNGVLDIDKIIAKSSRKRCISFDISKVTSLEKYNPNARLGGNYNKRVIACDLDAPNSYVMTVENGSKGNTVIVFAPDKRIRSAVKKYLPGFLANSAFNEGE